MKSARLLLLTSLIAFTSFVYGQIKAPFFPSEIIIAETTTGDTAFTFCPGDDTPDPIRVRPNYKNAPYAYLVTTPNGDIVTVQLTSSFDFNLYPAGEYQVWALLYIGTLEADVGENIYVDILASVYWELSANYISISNVVPDAGEVSIVGGGTSQFICPDDGVSDLLNFANDGDNAGGSYTYIITDEAGVVLDLAPTGKYDFEGSGTGTCLVWGLAYVGDVAVMIGDTLGTVPLATECFDLTNNSVKVTKANPEGGLVSLGNGQTDTTVCVGDGQDDLLQFFTDGGMGTDYSYLLANENGELIIQLAGNAINFDILPPGTARIYGLAYVGDFIGQFGDLVESVDLATGCFDLSDNYLTIVREQIEDHNLTLENGAMAANFCVNDPGAIDVQLVTPNPGGSSYTYLLTDANGIVLDISVDGAFDLTGFGAGTYRGWGVAYSGNLTIAIGDDATSSVLSDQCYQLSANSVTLIILDVNGGTVTLDNGDNSITICPGAPQPDLVEVVQTGSVGDNAVFLVTNANGVISAISTTSNINFAGTVPGTYEIWGLGYTGNLLATIGLPLDQPLSTGCFDLSDEPITVILDQPDGGTVATSEGDLEVLTCVGDGTPDLIAFVSGGASPGNYAYIVTDEDNNILALPPDNIVDFDGAGVGICRVWGLAYTGNLIANIGDHAGTDALSDDCYALSDTFVTVIRTEPDGGQISTAEGGDTYFFCAATGVASDVELQYTPATAANYAWLATDSQNVIIAVSMGDSIELGGLDPLPDRIWGVAYTGTFTAMTGDTASTVALSDDCYDLSDNFIDIMQAQPEAGEIQIVGGDTSITVCAGDGIPDVVTFENTADSSLSFVYLVTTEEDSILSVVNEVEIDFDGAGEGICRVYGLSYIGDLLAEPGLSLNDMLAEDCYDLTDNFVEVIRDAVDGGVVNSNYGLGTVYTCSGDGMPDVLTFSNNSSSSAAYTYFITTEDNIVITELNSAEQDFENTGFDVLRIWGLSYSGDLLAGPGTVIDEDVLSSACFALSANFITVVQDQPEATGISTADGSNSVQLCLGGSGNDLDLVIAGNSMAGTAWVVTDTFFQILAVQTEAQPNLFPFGDGVFYVYGLSYTGQLLPVEGEIVNTAVYSNSCYELTPDYVVVQVGSVLDAGSLSSQTGETEFEFCPGDGVSDPVLVIPNTMLPDSQFQVVLTDENDNVIIPNLVNSFINFDIAPPGIYHIWGVGFTGDATITAGMNLQEDALSDSCYALTSNFLNIVSLVPEAATVALSDSTTSAIVVVGDGQPDLLEFINFSTQPFAYEYILTDTNAVVQGLVSGNTVDFEGFMPGISRVYGLTYLGNATYGIGDTLTSAMLADNCYDLSDNFVTVERVSSLDDPDVEAIARDHEDVPYSIGDLQIVPNPATDQVRLRLQVVQPETAAVLRIWDGSGRQVFQQSLELVRGLNEHQINVYAFVPGFYTIRVDGQHGAWTSRMLKQ